MSRWRIPSPHRPINQESNNELSRELDYNRENLAQFVANYRPILNEDQRAAYNSYLDAIINRKNQVFFLDAPGGTGKTFLINLLLSDVRSRGEIMIAVASSGIAATLLHGGRTAHSAFKIEFGKEHMSEVSCRIHRGTNKAQLLERCSAIIWDECTMANKKNIEAVDRCLKDIRRNDLLFGGLVMIFAGDFRQTLPVIRRGTPAEEIAACLKHSYIWPSIIRHTLSINMRVQLNADARSEQFARQILNLGNGLIPREGDSYVISIPQDICSFVDTIDGLIQKVFPDILNNIQNDQWLRERAILAPTNSAVDSINSTIQDKLMTQATSYYSIDRTNCIDDVLEFPLEFLNSLRPSGIPLHKLDLKVGVPIMLIRNMDPPKLCNGTRLRVVRLHPNVIEASIITGPGSDEGVFIPRIPHTSDENGVSFIRHQFPIKLSFAMTINKSQGQTLRYAGIDLSDPCFSHGQLYVACSRVGHPENLYIMCHERRTKNVVYNQAIAL